MLKHCRPDILARGHLSLLHRLSLGAFRTSPVESLYVETNESLYRRRERLSLQYAIKLSSTPNNPHSILSSDPSRPNAIPTFGLRIKDLIDEANINIDIIHEVNVPEFPPWELEHTIIVYGLQTVKKIDTNPLVFQGIFNDVQDKYVDHQFLYTDGSRDDHKVGCTIFSSLSIIICSGH